MLFNSYEFIFGFFPLVLAGFFLLGMASRGMALGWLTAASLFFYAWWRPLNVLIIAPAILVNYVLARALLQLAGRQGRQRLADGVLGLGIVFNIAFLGYFKYRNFFCAALNDIAGTQFALTQIILPLGISFITFQKIAFLADVHGRRVEHFSFREYCLFVLFFPQLIAGPIVHFREIMPQFRQSTARASTEDLAIGMTLFGCGLFKKSVLADGIARYVVPVYDLAAAGGEIGLASAWLAALGFTLQIYFDFSGYSDMALGLGRCFGVRLPANFDSPLKATSIIDFWARWHMTLTRFLTAYLYNPLALWLTRRRLARGKPGFSPRSPTAAAFVRLLALPTVLTMVVSGLWHGAGYLFLLWGLVHGLYLVVNHAWRVFAPRVCPAAHRLLKPQVARVLTLLAVVVSMVLFRSPNWPAAQELLVGMVGLNGLDLPRQLHAALSGASGLPAWIWATGTISSTEFIKALGWLLGLSVVTFGLPNTLEVLARHEPALHMSRRPPLRFGGVLEWRPTLPWAVGASAVAVAGIVAVQGKSEFLYWQF